MSHRWTPEERDLVRREYHRRGAVSLAAELGTSARAVSLVVAHSRRGRPWAAPHEWTEAEDEMLRQDFTRTKASAAALARRLGLSPNQVYTRCGALGLRNTSGHRPWTPAEDAELERLYNQGLGRKALARRLRRSVYAVQARMTHRLNLRARENREGWYTKRDACALLGKDRRWMQRHIDSGALKAGYRHGRRPEKGNGETAWEIREKDLCRFVLEHAADLTGANVDLVGLLDLVTGGKVGMRLEPGKAEDAPPDETPAEAMA